MKKYEVMYIIRPELEAAERDALIAEVNAMFESFKSTVAVDNSWGLRDLAYEIKGCRKGFYVVLNVEATNEAILEFDRIAKIKETIIRHIVVAV